MIRPIKNHSGLDLPPGFPPIIGNYSVLASKSSKNDFFCPEKRVFLAEKLTTVRKLE